MLFGYNIVYTKFVISYRSPTLKHIYIYKILTVILFKQLNPCDDFYEFACHYVSNVTTSSYKVISNAIKASMYTNQQNIGYNIIK